MKIVIAGAGKVGYTIASRLSKDGHDITLIDTKRDRLESAANAMDLIGCCGNCAVPSTLKEAEAGSADVFIAATANDEANLVACQLAGRMGARRTVIRLHNQEYLDNEDTLKDIMGLNLAINPDYTAAVEISRVLQFPAAMQVDAFPDCGMEIVTFRISEDSRLCGAALSRLGKMFSQKVLVCAAEHNGNYLIPDGSYIMQAGDCISVTATPRELRKFFIAAGSYQKPVRSVILLGGSRISVFLTRLLESTGVSVKIIDSDYVRCQELAEMLQTADIVCADGSDTGVLEENGISDTDGFVALTGFDEDNIILSIYAHRSGVEKVVSKVNNDRFTELLFSLFPDTTLSPKNLVAERIDGYIRSLNNASDTSTMEALYYLGNEKVTATEFHVGVASACVGKSLAELKLKSGILLAAVTRNGKSFIPDGGTVLAPGDRTVVITAGIRLTQLDDILR